MREIAGAKVRSQPRSRLRWSNGRSRAQWIFQTAPGLDEVFNLVEDRVRALQAFS